jgi:hypothetical protein
MALQSSEVGGSETLSVFVSVAICTRNRAEQLRHVLGAVGNMRGIDGLGWELVVVDNGSTDHTKEVVEAFRGQLPVRWVFEPVAGLSNARNRAVAEAKGDYICWTDDDVEVDADWLASYVDVFRRYPQASVFGGRIQPVLLGTTPPWFARNLPLLSYLMAERDLGPVEIKLTGQGDLVPFGANYAIRTVEQRQSLYDPQLGVGPGQKRLGEETAVVRNILADGGQGVWVPASLVRHLIPESRQSKAYVLTYEEAAGQSVAYLSDQSVAMTPDSERITPVKLLGVPFWLVRGMVTAWLLSCLYGLFGKSSLWLENWKRYGFCRGGVDYYFARRSRMTQPESALNGLGAQVGTSA